MARGRTCERIDGSMGASVRGRSSLGMDVERLGAGWVSGAARRADWRNKRLDVVVCVLDNGFLAYS